MASTARLGLKLTSCFASLQSFLVGMALLKVNYLGPPMATISAGF